MGARPPRPPPPEAERGAGPRPPGSGRPTRPARRPRLTRSGALHGGGASGPHVSAGGGGGGGGDEREQRPRTRREAEAEAGAGPGSGGRRAGVGAAACGAGSGRGDQACGGAEAPESLSPQKVHAQAARALGTGRRDRPDAAAEPRFGLRAGVGDSGERRPARGGERGPLGARSLLGAQSPPSPCSGAAPAALDASVISRGPAFPVPRFER